MPILKENNFSDIKIYAIENPSALDYADQNENISEKTLNKFWLNKLKIFELIPPNDLILRRILCCLS